MGTKVPVIGSHGVPSARLRPVPPSVFCFLFVLLVFARGGGGVAFGGGTSAMLLVIGAHVDGVLLDQGWVQRRREIDGAARRGLRAAV